MSEPGIEIYDIIMPTYRRVREGSAFADYLGRRRTDACLITHAV